MSSPRLYARSVGVNATCGAAGGMALSSRYLGAEIA
jgi:hypothetical protein